MKKTLIKNLDIIDRAWREGVLHESDKLFMIEMAKAEAEGGIAGGWFHVLQKDIQAKTGQLQARLTAITHKMKKKKYIESRRSKEGRRILNYRIFTHRIEQDIKNAREKKAEK